MEFLLEHYLDITNKVKILLQLALIQDKIHKEVVLLQLVIKQDNLTKTKTQ
jgi:hypothetical protein